jgi:hypothetical protein
MIENMKILITTIILLFPSIAFAGSSSVNQTSFVVNGISGEVTTSSMRVNNTDTINQRYELSQADSFVSLISVSPAEFYLNPSESQDVVIRFRQPQESSKTQLALLSFDSNQTSQLKVGNGIKFPVEFLTSQVAGAVASDKTLSRASSVSTWHIAIYILDIMLVALASWLINRRKFAYSHSNNYKINFIV